MSGQRSTVRRHCFQLQVAVERLEEYRRRHAAVWPEMLQALKAAGWSNYSLFLREDGLLIGYLESDRDFDAIQAEMAATEVNARWQREMAALFEGLDSTPDNDLVLLSEIFHLEDQLGDEGRSDPSIDSKLLA